MYNVISTIILSPGTTTTTRARVSYLGFKYFFGFTLPLYSQRPRGVFEVLDEVLLKAFLRYLHLSSMLCPTKHHTITTARTANIVSTREIEPALAKTKLTPVDTAGTPSRLRLGAQSDPITLVS